MRALSVLLLLLGLYLVGSAAYDEYRGLTHKPGIVWHYRWTKAYLYKINVRRSEDPDRFHEFMVAHWIYAGLTATAGGLLFIKARISRPDYDDDCD